MTFLAENTREKVRKRNGLKRYLVQEKCFERDKNICLAVRKYMETARGLKRKGAEFPNL